MFTENTFTKYINSKLAKEKSLSRNTSKAEKRIQKNTSFMKIWQCVEWYKVLKKCGNVKRQSMCVGCG